MHLHVDNLLKVANLLHYVTLIPVFKELFRLTNQIFLFNSSAGIFMHTLKENMYY